VAVSTEVARKFRDEINELRQMLEDVPADLADVPWRAGGWSRKQIVGHLLDSAANNRQRFVRATTEGSYTGPGYAQDAWVEAHGYAYQSWKTLVEWWRVEHELLLAVVDRIPEERMSSLCTIGDGAPVTLRYLIEDYTRHQFHHFEQIRASLPGR
jgi:hypothetical protein